ncbi:hypothetical protein [Stieleria sp.]|uniref:hypothetical protein n=1 Tax=Stieleria sp. TaxID=2795976 RepID=UPI0035634502
MSSTFCSKTSRYAICVLLAFSWTESRAAIVTIGDFSTTPSGVAQSGSVDIFIEDDGSLPIEVAAFQLKVTVVGGDAGAVLTGFGAPSSRPYVFSGASSMPAGLISNDFKIVELGDFLLSGTRNVLGGEGLASLQFSIPANATKNFKLDLSLNPQDTFLANGAGQNQPFTIRGGSISVTAIPEPSVAALLLCVPAMYVCMTRRRRRSA